MNLSQALKEAKAEAESVSCNDDNKQQNNEISQNATRKKENESMESKIEFEIETTDVGEKEDCKIDEVVSKDEDSGEDDVSDEEGVADEGGDEDSESDQAEEEEEEDVPEELKEWNTHVANDTTTYVILKY